MCGRYVSPEGTEIRPGDLAPVITSAGAEKLLWGIPFSGGKLIINARSETAADKPMFAHAMRAGRCMIEVSSFFEWDKRKQQHVYTAAHKEKLYLAAIYTLCNDGKKHFTVLTREATDDAQKVHPRMPCFLPNAEYRHLWLNDSEIAPHLLAEHVPLTISPVPRESEQTSLFEP
ncbi:MAG: SOS response-associated peptidase family protein [Clostridia bacterium]|nr:SOS response-associated peptidase family protein [Clostridia bacterium]